MKKIFNLIMNVVSIHLIATLFGTFGVSLLLFIMTSFTIMSQENIWETAKAMFFWATPVTVIIASTLKLVKFK